MEAVSGGERQYVRLSPRPMGGGNTKHAHRRRSRNTTPHKPGPASKGGQCRCGGTLFSVHLPVRSALISMQGSSRSGGLEAGPPCTVCTKFEAVSVKPPKTDFPEKNSGFFGKPCFGDFTENATGGQTHLNPISQWGLIRVYCEIDI